MPVKWKQGKKASVIRQWGVSKNLHVPKGCYLIPHCSVVFNFQEVVFHKLFLSTNKDLYGNDGNSRNQDAGGKVLRGPGMSEANEP